MNGSVLRTAVIFFYISNEGVSLLENAGHLGLPIPQKMKDVLEQLHDRGEGSDEALHCELVRGVRPLFGSKIYYRTIGYV